MDEVFVIICVRGAVYMMLQTVVPALRQGVAIRTLFEELKETLDYTRTVKNSITGYSLVELERFVANSAALIDEGIRYGKRQ